MNAREWEEREAREDLAERRRANDCRFHEPTDAEIDAQLETLANPSRIGSACWYRPADIPGAWRGGRLRAWGTDFDQPDGTGEGFALFPVAVIEDDETKMCVSIYVTRVCFAETPG